VDRSVVYANRNLDAIGLIVVYFDILNLKLRTENFNADVLLWRTLLK
jgi:hypothetical protein